jgi:hypothetical protein
MDIILSFDSEDWLTPEAADGERWWADELHSRGIRGSFQCVAEMIRVLQRTGRDDVIDAIARHEIGYHSNLHSQPPTHAEALEGKPLAEAVEWVYQREAAGFATLIETFRRVPVTYCQPGDSWTPATFLAMASLGVRATCDAPFSRATGRPLWYCGLLTFAYDIGFDAYFGESADEEARFVRNFEAVAEHIGNDGVLVAYTHPTRLVTAAFWDTPFFKGLRPDRETLGPTPLWPDVHVQRLKDRCRRWLDWIQAIPDIRFATYAELYARHASNGRTLTELLDECGLAPDQVGRLPMRDVPPGCYLTSGDFDALRYDWAVLPEDFTGAALIEQARQLAWTSAPASCR